jgi:hypothetical protein
MKSWTERTKNQPEITHKVEGAIGKCPAVINFLCCISNVETMQLAVSTIDDFD